MASDTIVKGTLLAMHHTQFSFFHLASDHLCSSCKRPNMPCWDATALANQHAEGHGISIVDLPH